MHINEYGEVSMTDVRQETHKSALLQKLINCLLTGELTGDAGVRLFEALRYALRYRNLYVVISHVFESYK